MARRAGGRGRRRVVPGVQGAMLTRLAAMDGAFCMRPLGAPCMWCAKTAGLRALDRSTTFTGEAIYGAICARDDASRRHRDLMRDNTLYAITGPDTLEAVHPISPARESGRRPMNGTP